MAPSGPSSRWAREPRSWWRRSSPLRAGGSQLERISLPGLAIAPPDRRSRLCPYLLYEPGFEKLGYGPLGLGALWTCRWNQAMIIALRRSAEQHKLRVVAYDRHV